MDPTGAYGYFFPVDTNLHPMRTDSTSIFIHSSAIKSSGFTTLHLSLYATTCQLVCTSHRYFYFRAFTHLVTLKWMSDIATWTNSQFSWRDFHPLALLFYWLQPHQTVHEVCPHTAFRWPSFLRIRRFFFFFLYDPYVTLPVKTCAPQVLYLLYVKPVAHRLPDFWCFLLHHNANRSCT